MLPEGTLRQPCFLYITSRGPKSGTKQHLDDITDIRFQRNPHPSGERAAREGCQKRPTGSDKDLFVPE